MPTPRSMTLIAGAACLLALAACSQDKGAPSAAESAAEPAAVTVNGTRVSRKTVDMMVAEGAGSGRPDTPEYRKAIVDNLVLQVLAADEAVKAGLDKVPETADRIAAIRRSLLANAYVQDFLEKNPVTDDALAAEYERIKSSAAGSEYKARHILVEGEAEAKDIIARLGKDPKAFARLAAERSKDPGSSASGGDLGWFDARRMVPEFGAALGKLEKGKYTEEPVKTQFGYHVILLEDTRPIEPPALEEVKPMLSRQLQQQNVMKHLEALKASAKIEVAPEAAAAPAGPGTPAPATPPSTAK